MRLTKVVDRNQVRLQEIKLTHSEENDNKVTSNLSKKVDSNEEVDFSIYGDPMQERCLTRQRRGQLTQQFPGVKLDWGRVKTTSG